MSKDDETMDIFRKAAESSIKKALVKEVEEVKAITTITEDKLQELKGKANDIMEEHVSRWDEFGKKMDGTYLERFMTEMETLSGREFIRTYLKAAEFFKPKVTRRESEVEIVEDNTLTIVVKQSSHNYDSMDEKTIDVDSNDYSVEK